MKKGFTLAEVLVTIGIIGVVAAIVAPMINTALQKSKVAPSLRKVVSTLENAHEHILSDNEEGVLSAVVLETNSEEESQTTELPKYLKELKKYLIDSKAEVSDLPRGRILRGPNGQLPDGYTYRLHIILPDSTKISFSIPQEVEPIEDGGTYKGRIMKMRVDINGANNPNSAGKDRFYFYVDDSGAIYPKGGKIDALLLGISEPNWKKNCNETEIKDATDCAGSIFDNNMKIIYKY